MEEASRTGIAGSRFEKKNNFQFDIVQDVLDMARDVMRHRLVLSFEALSDSICYKLYRDAAPA